MKTVKGWLGMGVWSELKRWEKGKQAENGISMLYFGLQFLYNEILSRESEDVGLKQVVKRMRLADFFMRSA